MPDSLSLRHLSPVSLAYLGDAVYELYVRSRYLYPAKKISDYHNQVVNCVRAESQAQLLQSLKPYLSEQEQDLVRRGRNAAGRCPARLSPRIYQEATALEALIGYLYLTDPARLEALLNLDFIDSN